MSLSEMLTPFSVSLPFYITASGQILLGSPAEARQTQLYLGCPKGQCAGNGHKFKPQWLSGMTGSEKDTVKAHKETQPHQ